MVGKKMTSKVFFAIITVCLVAAVLLLQMLLQPSSIVMTFLSNVVNNSNGSTTTTASIPHVTFYQVPRQQSSQPQASDPNTGSIDSTSTIRTSKKRQLQRPRIAQIPQFVGEWERIVSCPLSLGEAHGGVIANQNFIITGGFLNFTTVSRESFALDVRADNLSLKSSNVTWKKMDDYPFTLGVTHAAEAFYKSKMYICGGFNGYPGPVQADCFVFDQNRLPGRSNRPQYSRLPSLPEPRAGAGMVYDVAHHALIFVGGTRRNVTDSKTVVLDTHDTFILRLNDTLAGWTRNARPKPYSGNHISFVTVNDTCSGSKSGRQRHYFFGGQIGQNESSGNLDLVYEYIVASDTWKQRKSMSMGRGHTGTSSVPFGCGFILAGGAINNNVDGSNKKVMTDDISYYSSYTDTWVTIGKLPRKAKTPVCGIVHSPQLPINKSYLFCTTGYTSSTFRREVIVL